MKMLSDQDCLPWYTDVSSYIVKYLVIPKNSFTRQVITMEQKEIHCLPLIAELIQVIDS